MTEVHEGDSTSTVKSQSREQTIAIYFLIIVAAIIGGYYLSVALIPKPKVGIISVETSIGGAFATVMAREVDYAIKARDIKSVVLVINSPGGAAYAGHDVYYQVRQLRDEKPVVASMEGLAASAAYQIGVAANEIYAKPASLIGNIGVIMGQPGPETLSEQFVTTGPFKAVGASATGALQMLDLNYVYFRDSVVIERENAPNPLKLSPDEVATGELWIGIQAKEHGLIDELGSTLEAIDRAAQLAGLTNYEVVDVRDEYLASLEGSALLSALELYEELDAQPSFDLNAESDEWPTFYQLYIPLE